MSKNIANSKIEIRRWDVLDIYYKTVDRNKVEVICQDYVKQGWSVESDDTAGNKDYDECIQLMKHHKPITKRIS